MDGCDHADVTRVIIAFFMMPTEDELEDEEWPTRVLRTGFRLLNPLTEHCQILFVHPSTGREKPGVMRMTTFSTTKQYPFCQRDVAYSHQNWKAFVVHGLDARQRHSLFHWCRERDGAPFNGLGFYLNFLPCTPRCCTFGGANDRFFCSQMVAAGLQHVTGDALLPGVHPHLCKTDDLYLVCCKDVMNFTPYRAGPITSSAHFGLEV